MNGRFVCYISVLRTSLKLSCTELLQLWEAVRGLHTPLTCFKVRNFIWPLQSISFNHLTLTIPVRVVGFLHDPLSLEISFMPCSDFSLHNSPVLFRTLSSLFAPIKVFFSQEKMHSSLFRKFCCFSKCRHVLYHNNSKRVLGFVWGERQEKL